MRSIWKGAINFGMVTIPVKLYTATEQKDVRFRLVHARDGAPIEEKRFCTAEDKEVQWEELARGYEVSKGEFVVVAPEEIEEAVPETTRTIEIGDFVELEEIDPIYFEKSYFLEPVEAGAKPFNLLRRALDETGRVAVARVAIRSKERLATLRVYDETLVLETMYWPDEIRSTGSLELPSGRAASPAPKEVEMAHSLVENLSSRFDAEQYQDRYRIALQELIEAKMSGEKRAAKRRKPQPKVVDLMDALEASLAAAREGKSGAKSAEAGGKSGRSGAKAGRSGARSRARKKSSGQSAKSSARSSRSAA
jgi:DNA end-binding protein Ku